MTEKPRPKLNKDLDVDEFEICIPKSCRLSLVDQDAEILDGQDEKEKGWEAYFETLGATKSPKGNGKLSDQPTTCFGAPGWVLRGKPALKHALRVHRRISDEILRQPGTAAVDVGFAVKERSQEFDNTLSIRIHVGDKRPNHLLEKAGHADFTNLRYLIASRVYRLGTEEGTILDEPYWEGRWEKLLPYLYGLEPSQHPEGEVGDFGEFVEMAGKLVKNMTLADFRYPIFGLSFDDLGCHPFDIGTEDSKGGDPNKDPEEKALRGELPRLTVCGVPLDILGIEYHPSMRPKRIGHRPGIFIEERGTSLELTDREMQSTGKSRVEPLVGGVSVGGTNGRAGTVAAIVWDRTDGQPCILSNWHVLAGNREARFGQPVYQPSLFDGGTADDVVAHLERWYFGKHGDAALAKLNGTRDSDSGEVLGMWSPISGIRKPELGLRIRKWGRTSGFSEGFIDGIQLTAIIDFGGTPKRFENQFRIAPLRAGEPVSLPGDSGSLVLTRFDLDELFLCRDTLKQAAKDSVINSGDGLKPVAGRVWNESGLPPGSGGVVEEIADVQPPPTEVVAELDIIDSKGSETKASGGPGQESPGTKLQSKDLTEAILALLEDQGFDLGETRARLKDRQERSKLRLHFAVGMIFAGDTPGSPLGEFAIASDIGVLADELDFSLRPVFAPRSSFREVIVEGNDRGQQAKADRSTGGSAVPGELGASGPGTGPGGDPEKSQGDPPP